MMKTFLKLKTLFLFCLLAVFIFSVAGFNENKEVQHIEAATSSCKGPADVMLVIDRSGPMGDDLKFSNAKNASVNFVDKLFSTEPTTSYLPGYNDHQIGLVAFNQNIDARQLKKIEYEDEIKNDINDTNGILGDEYPTGFRHTDAAIYKAGSMMKVEGIENPYATKTMIILTDGVPNNLDAAKAQADTAKNEDNNIRIIVVGLKLDKIADETDRDNAKEFIKYIASSPADCFYVYDSGEALANCTSIDASELGTALDGVYNSITAAVCDESDPTISISKKPFGTLYKDDYLKITSTAIDDVGFKEHTIIWSDNWPNNLQTVECADLAGTTVTCGAGECVEISCDTGDLGSFGVGQTITYRSVVIDANDNSVNIDPPKTVSVANVDLDIPVLYRNKNNTITVDISNYVYAADDVISISIDAPVLGEGVIEIDKVAMTCSGAGTRNCVYNFNTKNHGDGCLDWTDGITNGKANNINVDVYIYAYSDDMGTRQIALSENQSLVSYFEGPNSSYPGTCSDGLNNDCDYDGFNNPIIDSDEALCDITGPDVGILRDPADNVYDDDSITFTSNATDDNGIKQHTIFYRENSGTWQTIPDSDSASISGTIGPLSPGVVIEYYSWAMDYSGNDNENSAATESFIVKNRECEGIGDTEPPTACKVNTSGRCCGGVCDSEISNPDSYNTVHCAEEICSGISWEYGPANDTDICSESEEPTECHSFSALYGPQPGNPPYFHDGGCEERAYRCSSGYCDYGSAIIKEDYCIGGGSLILNDYECSGTSCVLNPDPAITNDICDVELDSLSINAYDNEDTFICGGSEATGEVLDSLTNKVSLTASVSDSNGIGDYKIYWQVDGGTWNNSDCGVCADGVTCSCAKEIGAFSPGQVVKFYAWAKDGSPNGTEKTTTVYSFTVRDHQCYYINSQDDKGIIANLTLCGPADSDMCCGGTCDGDISATSYDEGCFVDSCSGTNWVSIAGNENVACGISDTCFDYYSPNVDFYSGCMNGGNKCSSGYCVLSSSETFPSSCNGNLLTSYDCDDYETGTCKKRDTGTDIDCSVAGSYDSDSVACNCDCNNYDIEEKIYSSLKFDGVDDYVDISDDNSLDIPIQGGGDITMEAWIYPLDLTSEMNIISKHPNYKMQIRSGGGGELKFATYGWTSSGSLTVNNNEWSHVVITYNGTSKDLIFYINGVSIIKPNYIPNGGVSSGKLLLGEDFNGSIDEVRIYNRALYPEEVEDHYNGIFADNTGLVGHWNFDEGTGKTAYDYHDSTPVNNNTGTLKYSANNGTLVGGPVWASGKYSNAISFDGDNDYVSLGSMSNWNPDTGNSSIELWFKTNEVTSSKKRALFSDNWGPEMGIWLLEDGRLCGYAYQSVCTSFTISSDTWYHTMLAFNVSTRKIIFYVNGAKQGELTMTIGNGLRDTPYWVGGDYNGGSPDEFFDGLIDEVRIYNRALSETEVAEHYKSIFSNNSGLVGYWDFNEGSGTTAYDSSKNGPQWMKHYHGSATGTGGNVPENWQACTDGKDNDCDLTVDDYIKETSGVADELGGADTLIDNDMSWIAGEWEDGIIEIVSGTGSGQIRTVGSNTTNTITVNTDWDAGDIPDSISGYKLVKMPGNCDGEVDMVSVMATAKDSICAADPECTSSTDLSANNYIAVPDINIRNAINDFTLTAGALDDFLIYQTRIEWTVDNWGTTNSKTCNGTGVCVAHVGEGVDEISSSLLSADNIFKFKVCAVDNSVNNNQKCTDEYAIEILSSNAVPVITPLSVIEPNFCLEGLKYILKWEFSDDGADAQASFEIQVEDVETGNLVVNKTFSASDLFYQINSDDFETGEEIEYGSKAYNWRVKVTDNRGGGYEQTTDWEAGPAFTTPPHEYPQFDFVAVPDFSDNCLYEIDAVGTDRCDYGENITFSPQNLTFIECTDVNDKQCLTTTAAKCDLDNNMCVPCEGNSECQNFNSGGVGYVCNTVSGVCEISGSCVTDIETDCCVSDNNCMAADIARCDLGIGLCVVCDDDSQCEKFNEENIGKGSLGDVSSGGSNTLTDDSKLWLENEWAGGTVKIVSGTGSNQTKTIISNTSEEITVDSNWTSIPNSSSDYKIIKYICNNEGVCEDKEHRKWWFYGDDSLDVDSRDPHPINNYIESEVSDYNVILKIKDIFGNSCSRVKKIILGINKYPKWNEVSPSN